ncbi:GNAT family N-acetyltransferase [Pontibacter sp. CAU 1760]
MARLTTERFILKEIDQQDKEHIFQGLSDPKVTQYYAVHFPTREATQEQMDWYADLKKNGTGLWWGIYTKDTDTFCGAGGYNGLDKTHRKAEIGFWLLPAFWGQGILKEVMPKLFELGFEKLGLNRIEGFVEHNNLKCKRALEKVNFRYEGTMRQCEIKNGKFIDVDIYANLREV